MEAHEAKSTSRNARTFLEAMPYVAPGFVMSLSLSHHFKLLGNFYSDLLGNPQVTAQYTTTQHIKLSVLTSLALIALGIVAACGGEILKFAARYFQGRRSKEKYNPKLVEYFKNLYFLEPARYEYARALSQKASYVSSMAFALLVNIVLAFFDTALSLSHFAILGSFLIVCTFVSYYLVNFETHIYIAIASLGKAASEKENAQPVTPRDAPTARP